MHNRYCVFWSSSDCRKVLAFWNYACSDHDNTIRCCNTEANFCCKDVFLERGTTFIWFLGSFKIHIAGHTKQVTWPKWRRALDVVRQYLRTHFANIFRKLINQNRWNFFVGQFRQFCCCRLWQIIEIAPKCPEILLIRLVLFEFNSE